MKRWHLLVAEAAGLLILARLLVAGPSLLRWRHWLGPLTTRSAETPPDGRDRQLARAVERAALQLPGEAKCLPRAMALHWMLRRRRRANDLVIAVLPGTERGGLDDLHAWVEMDGTILIGDLNRPFRPLARFGGPPQG